MTTLRELGEIETLSRLRAARRPGAGVVVDSGDDAAVLRLSAGAELVATTDALVEGGHFLPEWLDPAGVGARLATVNLSDLAAMAALPRWGLLSIGVRAEHEIDALLALQRGLADTLEAAGASLVGGNLVAVTGPEWFDLSLLGEADRGRAWTRHGARPGDVLAVSGSPGWAGAGFRLAHQHAEEARGAAWQPLVDAWARPVARVALARAVLATGAVSAAIDISDGLAGDLARLCEASQVGADIDETGWAPDPLLARAAERLGVAPEALRYGPSDDYELLLALDPARVEPALAAARALGLPLAVIGGLTEAPGVLRRRASGGEFAPMPGAGYDHFGGA